MVLYGVFMARPKSGKPKLSGAALAKARRKNGAKGGRPPGALNKATVEKLIRAKKGLKAALATGVMPLDVILGRMRGTLDVTDDQVAAAIAAAPFCHPKLTAVAFRDTTPPKDPIDLSRATAAELAVLRKFIARTAPGAPSNSGSEIEHDGDETDES
jgi:hypothetical protein